MEKHLNEMKSVGPPVRILYIMGAARSGSTVLDTVLGNHPEIESVGELVNLPRVMSVSGEYCGCGQLNSCCSFWREVQRLWMERSNLKDVTEYIDHQDNFMRLSRLPHSLRKRVHAPSQFQTYAEWTYTLFEAIRTVSGKSIIVDSSKTPARALALSLISGLDLNIIHLVRDARGVVWSKSKAYKADPKKGLQKDIISQATWQTAKSWASVNLKSAWVRRQLAPEQSIRVLYEDFTAAPRTTLDKIGTLIDSDFGEVAQVIESGRALHTGHTIAGNRLRMSKTIHLRPDGEWIQRMPVKDRWLCWAQVGWLMRHYGYK